MDWKYWLGIIVTLAGVVVPVWVWQLDSGEKSLKVCLESSYSLTNVDSDVLPNLEVIVDGVKIETPYISILELSNDGKKAILASDFEKPVKFFVGSSARIIRVKLLKSFPEGISPDIDNDEKEIILKPALFNPGDKVRILVLTSGEPMGFKPLARISGVSSINYEDSSKFEFPISSFLRNGFLLVACLVLYSYYGAKLISPNKAVSNLAVLILSMIYFAMTSGRSAFNIVTALDVNYKIHITGPSSVISIVASLFCAILIFCFSFKEIKRRYLAQRAK